MSVRNRDDAMDLVQNSMIKLATKYAGKPPEQWPPLFYRILQNSIRDWQRRETVRRRVFLRKAGTPPGSDEYDPLDSAPDLAGRGPFEQLSAGQAIDRLQAGLAGLPRRQREAFMLRTFEGLSVADSALAMGCREGSVKTHYSRAVHRLRELIGEQSE